MCVQLGKTDLREAPNTERQEDSLSELGADPSSPSEGPCFISASRRHRAGWGAQIRARALWLPGTPFRHIPAPSRTRSRTQIPHKNIAHLFARH